MGSPEDGAYLPKIQPHAIRPKRLSLTPATAEAGNAIVWRPVERLIRVAYMCRAVQTRQRVVSGRKI